MANDATTDLAAVLGGNIRSARLAAGWTQHQLAVELGRGDSMTVSRWERGEHQPSQENMVRLASLLEVDVAWLYTEHEEAA